jgi:hypothetical protein
MRLEHSRRLVVSLITVAVLSLGAVLPAAAAPAPTPAPPTLTGEQFFTALGHGIPILCGNNGPFSFSISGIATGPYPGPFTEAGSGTVGPASLGVSPIITFTATFTIHSPTGDVTGTKTLSGSGGACYHDAGNFELLPEVNMAYQATIHTPNGNYTDHGTSTLFDVFESSGTADSIFERFTSSQTRTTLIVPTSKDQCKGNSWRNYPQFKNQGECVSFVEHTT